MPLSSSTQNFQQAVKLRFWSKVSRIICYVKRNVSIISWHLSNSTFSVRFATFGRVTHRFECNNSRVAGRIFVKYGIVISQQELPICSGFDINGKRVTGTSYGRVLRACIHCEYKCTQVLKEDMVKSCVYTNIIHILSLVRF